MSQVTVEDRRGVHHTDPRKPLAQPMYFWLLLLSLATNMFSGYWWLMSVPVPFDRMLMLGGLLLAAMDRNVRVRARLRWRRLHTMMLLFTLWTVYSALAHETLWTSTGFWALLDRIVVPFVLFCLAPVLFDSEVRRTLLLKMLSLVGIYLGLLAIFEMFGPQNLVWPGYIMDPTVGILFGRARGPFVAAEANGMVVAMAGLAAAALFAKSSTFGWRVISVISMVLCGLAVVLSLTRSIWLGTALAIAVCSLMVPQLRKIMPRAVAFVVGLFALVMLLIPPAREALVDRLTTVRSVNDRQNTNAAAMRILEERPLDGIGWHRFIDVGTEWVRQADTYPITNVTIEIHNVPLSRAAELGIPAALLWIAIVFVGPFLALRHKQVGDLVVWRVLAVGFVIIWIQPTLFSPNPYPMPNNLLWLVTGIVAHPYLMSRWAQRADEENTHDRQGHREGPVPAGA